jgi:hypothetical protein
MKKLLPQIGLNWGRKKTIYWAEIDKNQPLKHLLCVAETEMNWIKKSRKSPKTGPRRILAAEEVLNWAEVVP